MCHQPIRPLVLLVVLMRQGSTGPAQRPAATPVHQKSIRSTSCRRADGSKRHFIMMRAGPDARPAPHVALNKPHFTPGVSSKRLGAGGQH